MQEGTSARSAWTIQKAVVLALILRELKTRFGANRFGYIWVPLEPALHLMVLVVVFGFLRQRVQAGVDFSIFLVVGLIPYLLFRNIAFRTMESMDANKALFAYRQIKPMDTYIARAVLDSAITLVVYVIMLFFMGSLGFAVVPAAPLELIVIHGIVVIFGLGFGIILSILVDIVPDAKLIIRILFMPLYFISGVMWPLSMVPQELLPYLLWNPLLHIVELARSAFFYNYYLQPGVSIQFVLLTTFLSFFIGLRLYYFRRLKMVRT